MFLRFMKNSSHSSSSMHLHSKATLNSAYLQGGSSCNSEAKTFTLYILFWSFNQCCHQTPKRGRLKGKPCPCMGFDEWWQHGWGTNELHGVFQVLVPQKNWFSQHQRPLKIEVQVPAWSMKISVKNGEEHWSVAFFIGLSVVFLHLSIGTPYY